MKSVNFSAYFAPTFVILMGWLFLSVPWLAAFVLGGGVLTVGCLYFWMVYRFQKFQHQSYQNRGPTHFEQRVYRNGEAPNLKTITISMFDR